jgi:hypothetical protein
MPNSVDFELVTEIDAENPVLHDLKLVNGQLVFLEKGLRATAQRLKIRLLFFLGEWYLDQRQGVPYWESVLVKNPNIDSIKAMFRRVIVNTPGIAGVDEISISFDRQNREAFLSFEAVTDDGQTLVFAPFLVTPQG